MKFLLSLVLSVLILALSGPIRAEEANGQYIQVAQIEIDPPQLDNYKSAVKEQIDTAIRTEPGVLTLYSVSDRDNPTHVTVFEIYRDIAAYQAHLQSAHFKKYKATTANMVKSLNLVRVTPIMLGAKRPHGPGSN